VEKGFYATYTQISAEAQGDESGSTEPHDHCAKSGNVLIKLAEDEWALGACPGT
jgi:hypothetical protein